MAAVIALSIRAATPPAVAGQNRNTPAPRAAAPAPHLGGGAPHMPGGMGGGMPGSMGGGMPGGMRGPGGFGAAGGGAHLPSGMAAGGAHVAGGMAVGGAHVPGGMGAGTHVPGSFGGAAHVPGGVAGHAPEAHFSPARPGGAPFGGASHEAGLRPGEHGVTGGREFGGREPGGHEAGPRFGGEGRGGEAHGFGAETGRHDPRLGGPGAGHTHGLEAGVAHHEARPYLHAEEHRDIGRDRAFAERHAGDFHSRNVHDFSARELATWRGGAWRREWHYGRQGWWWEVDGVWYPYPEPIWPYPLEVAELTVYEAAVIDGPEPNTIVAEGRPITIPPLPAAPAGRYRCDEPRGFYPAVASCSVPWELVADPPPSGLQSQD